MGAKATIHTNVSILRHAHARHPRAQIWGYLCEQLCHPCGGAITKYGRTLTQRSSAIPGNSNEKFDKCRKSWQFLKQHRPACGYDGTISEVVWLPGAQYFSLCKTIPALEPIPALLQPTRIAGPLLHNVIPKLTHNGGKGDETTTPSEITTPRKLGGFGARQPGGPGRRTDYPIQSGRISAA